MNFGVTIELFDDKKSLIILQRMDYVKYLGVVIDSTLTWKEHMIYFLKVSESLGIISRLRHLFPLIPY